MAEALRQRAPWILWPIAALWDLLAFVLRCTGRLIAAIVGLAMMAVGLALSATVIASPLGVPIAILGFLLLLRSVF